MSMLKEFKDFAMKGNVLDLAVGVIIGVAFGKVVTSMVNDIVMPPLGMALGQVNFSDLFINLGPTTYPSVAAAKAAGAPTINYGMFLNIVIEFVVVAFVVFLVVKAANKLKRPATPAVVTTKECPFCLSNIARGASRCPNCTSDLKAA